MTHQAVFRIAAIGALVAGAQRASAQQVPPVAPTATVGSSPTGAPSSAVGPYVSSTLPTTGHATRFKQYAGGTSGQQFGQQLGQSLGRSRGGGQSISPYLALSRGGDAATNYFFGVQPLQQLNQIGNQTTQANTQIGGLRRDIQSGTQQPLSLRPSVPGSQTPLQRQVIQQQQYVPSSDARDVLVLQDILKELKAIREHVAPVKEKTQD